MSGEYPVAPELNITYNGILKLIRDLNPCKAEDPGGVKPMGAEGISRQCGTYPCYHPLKGDRQKAESFRPISLNLLQGNGTHCYQP